MKRNLKTVRDLAAESPFTEPALRWMLFNAANNGLERADAIVRVSRRIYIDVDKFEGWIDAQNHRTSEAA